MGVPAVRFWTGGRAERADGPVLVSVTELRSHRWRDLPRVYRDALRLRRAWPGLDGAVGMWLWVRPLRRRSGSVSLWCTEADLRAFLGTPAHVAVMRRHREGSTVRSSQWTGEAGSRRDAWRRAAAWLADPA